MRQAAFITLAFLAGACGPGSPPPKPSATAPPAALPTPKATPAASADTKEREAVAALIGTKPPAWQVERWINSPPLELAKLRGSVVLVRWWTSGCPWCSASAPALRAFHRDYAPRGLKVIGMYHHKEDTPFEPSVYENTARKYEFTFPLAFDTDWRTLHSWMRDAKGEAVDTGWTSVTFVLDKRGVVRHVHPGGQYVAGEPAHAELNAVVERLLGES